MSYPESSNQRVNFNDRKGNKKRIKSSGPSFLHSSADCFTAVNQMAFNKPMVLALATAWVRLLIPNLLYILRVWVLTVLGER